MKIVLATGIYPPDIGGPATYVEKLKIKLEWLKFDVRVITYSDEGNSSWQPEVKRVSRKYFLGLRHFMYFCKLFWLARGADIIYAQNVTSAGLPALLAAKLLRKKFVLKVVGDAAWEQKKDYLKLIQGVVARGADKIIVPSRYVEKMVAGWGAEKSKINVIYNAAPHDPHPDISKQEAKKKIKVDSDIILSVGRLAPWKGFDDLVAIMPDLLKNNPNFQLVIVGGGEGISNLKSQISDLNLENQVILAGKVSFSETPFYFKAADVFILNSGYEGLSHVILEAMSFGVPAIASKEGGNPELIEDGFNGLLVEYKNKEQIKSAIMRLWQDKELREKFISNSREKLKDFSWKCLLEKTLQVLR